MSIYVCGDTHGDIDINKLTTKNFQGKKGDFLIVCGDFGVVWDNSSHDRYIQNWYNSKPWTTLFVDGNHENHESLDRYPVTEWNGGKIHKISDSIIHLMRGQVFAIDDKKIFTMGGATSHDKMFRIAGISWWDREMPSYSEYEEGLVNLHKHNNKVDYIITHCTCEDIQNLINSGYEQNSVTKYLNTVNDSVTFEKWFCGHYHIDEDIDNKHSVLYDRVVKL